MTRHIHIHLSPSIKKVKPRDASAGDYKTFCTYNKVRPDEASSLAKFAKMNHLSFDQASKLAWIFLVPVSELKHLMG
jgi:hypothetical protein